VTTAIQKTETVSSIAPFFTAEQEKMILSSFLGGASREEAAVLMEVARVRRLNPLLRQIHFVKRWDSQKREEVWAYQTSIDGLRAIAERTGRYEGQTPPQWCGSDGVWHDVWLAKTPPAAARVGVYKQGFREPLYGIARWESYVQTKKDGSVTQFWSRMADLMLSKCAEALALRKAFPEDMSGLYTGEEMGGEAGEPVEPVPTTRAELVKALVTHDAPDAGARQAPVVEAAKEVKAAAPPPYVMALWNRLVAEMGEAKAKQKPKTKAAWEAASRAVFGEQPKPSAEWAVEDAAKVEKHLFDVSF
jgi:phage recombination protein Bet